MPNDFQDRWKEAMDWWTIQNTFTQNLISKAAEQTLIRAGAEEVGSSDLNHSVFSLYQEFKTSNEDLTSFLMDKI